MSFNLAFRIPMEQKDAEANEGLRMFTEALVMCFVHTLTEEDTEQNIVVSICHCKNPDCQEGYPHALESIDSERPLSEQFLLNLSKVLTNVKLTQNEKRITVEYID